MSHYILVNIILLIILSIGVQPALCAIDLSHTIDDDTKLEFYWTPAQGNVDHYNIYLATYGKFEDEKNYIPIGKTQGVPAPTKETPYTVPITAEDGAKYELKVQAESFDGISGPMSESSMPVWCKLRSLGDINGPVPGDADGNLEVNIDDLQICVDAWGAKRDEKSFDYRADLNYDDSIDILDLVIVGKYLSNFPL